MKKILFLSLFAMAFVATTLTFASNDALAKVKF